MKRGRGRPPKTEHEQMGQVLWFERRVGGAIAPLLVVPIQVAFGWRMSFWIFGISRSRVGCGLVVVVSGQSTSEAKITTQELTEIGAVDSVNHDVPWSVLWRSRQLWTIVAMYGCYAWGSWFYFSWLHTWLVRGRGFTEAEMGIFSALPFVVGAAANVAGGYVSDAAVRRLGVRRGRTIVGIVCLSLAALLLIATAFTPSKIVAIGLLTAGFGIMDLMLPSAWAVCLDIGGAHAGSVTGAMNSAGQFGGFLCTILFGYIVDHYGDYNAPLFVIAAMLLTSAFLFSRIDRERPLFAAIHRPRRCGGKDLISEMLAEPSDRIYARYFIETAFPLEKAADVLAGEQSSGTFVKVPGETEELRNRHAARVESIGAGVSCARLRYPDPDARRIRTERQSITAPRYWFRGLSRISGLRCRI